MKSNFLFSLLHVKNFKLNPTHLKSHLKAYCIYPLKTVKISCNPFKTRNVVTAVTEGGYHKELLKPEKISCIALLAIACDVNVILK